MFSSKVELNRTKTCLIENVLSVLYFISFVCVLSGFCYSLKVRSFKVILGSCNSKLSLSLNSCQCCLCTHLFVLTTEIKEGYGFLFFAFHPAVLIIKCNLAVSLDFAIKVCHCFFLFLFFLVVLINHKGV